MTFTAVFSHRVLPKSNQANQPCRYQLTPTNINLWQFGLCFLFVFLSEACVQQHPDGRRETSLLLLSSFLPPAIKKTDAGLLA